MTHHVDLLLLDLFMMFFFFFKQKTAYEMRISDWSSDVCSSDLSATGTWRAMKVWSAVTISHATGIGSTQSCGIAACPPRPLLVALSMSAEASSGPGRPTTTPAGA